MPTQTPWPQSHPPTHPPTPAPHQAEMWQHLLACSIGPLGPSVSSSRVLPGLAGTEGKMSLLDCQGRSLDSLRFPASSPKPVLTAGGVCCPRKRKVCHPLSPRHAPSRVPPSPKHTIYTHSPPPPPRCGWALGGSGGEWGRWNVRSCRFKCASSSSETPHFSPPFSKPRELVSSQGPEWRHQGRRGPLLHAPTCSSAPPSGAEQSSLRVGEKGRDQGHPGMDQPPSKAPQGGLGSEALGHRSLAVVAVVAVGGGASSRGRGP